ncbi:hypothetical protein D9M68_820430 [compost metagenome]
MAAVGRRAGAQVNDIGIERGHLGGNGLELSSAALIPVAGNHFDTQRLPSLASDRLGFLAGGIIGVKQGHGLDLWMTLLDELHQWISNFVGRAHLSECQRILWPFDARPPGGGEDQHTTSL